MTFSDIFKRSFLDGYAAVELNTNTILAALAWTTILALYIYFCYRITTRRTFYSKNFNISLVAMALLTSAVILTIQSSVVVSLGMVGALSIVRFRTAIKDPMDLVFLFWSISVGIICGAGFAGIAVVASLFITVLIILFSASFKSTGTLVLVVNADSHEREGDIMKAVKECCQYSKTRARNVSKSGMNMAIEVKTSKPSALIDRLMKMDFVTDASLVENDSDIM